MSEHLERFERQFQRLLHAGQRALANGDASGAAEIARLAAAHGAYRHHGEFASIELEQLLRDLAGRCTSIEAPTRARSSDAVLHVLTEAFATGGHTRYLQRWVRNDDRPQGLVLTGDRALPQALARDAEKGGVTLHRLGSADLLGKAAELRALASAYAAVVLNVHPFDVVPAMAFAHRERPVVQLNLADHLPWCNASVVDGVISFRSLSNSLVVGRRGFRAEETCLLPIPLEEPPPADRDAAKKSLGIDTRSIVVLSAAASYKYESIGSDSFLDIIDPIARTNDSIVILAVGARSTRAWRAAAARTEGRIRTEPLRADPSVFFAAADIYLDTFPYGSMTSALEAAAMAVPVVSYCPYDGLGRMLTTNEQGLDDHIVRAATKPELAAHVEDLATSASRRAHVGGSLRAAVAAAHFAEPWRRQLEEVEAWIAARPSMVWPASDLGARGPLDDLLVSEAAHASLRRRYHLAKWPLQRTTPRAQAARFVTGYATGWVRSLLHRGA
jgi:hypothetical protein